MLRTFTCLILLSANVAFGGSGCAGLAKLSQDWQDPGQVSRQRKAKIERIVATRHRNARLKAGYALLGSGEYERCHMLVSEVLDKDPDNRDGLLLQAEAFVAQDRFPEAAETYRHLIQVHPDDASLHHLLGVSLELAGDQTGARAAFRQAAHLAPESTFLPWDEPLSRVADFE